MDTRERASEISGDVEKVLKGMREDFSLEIRENMILKALTYIIAEREEALEKKIEEVESELSRVRVAAGVNSDGY